MGFLTSSTKLDCVEPDIVKDVPEGAIGTPETSTSINSVHSQNLPFKNTLSIKSILGYIEPFFNICRPKTIKKDNNWEIPFEDIKELEWIGSGAQGAVFLGKWKSEEVAIKKVRSEKDTCIKDLIYLEHKNVVKFRGVCSQGPGYSLVMEYCPFGQLYEALRRDKEVTPTLLVNWSRQIADGMAYLHSHKIIHRDLKSPNILISYNDTLKISDFGTWKPMSEKSTNMTFTGTVAWMAPEVIRNDPCSEKVDIWSYGVLVWELLTEEIPYKGVDYSALIWGVGNNSLKLPIPSSCPEGFKLLLNLCWNNKAKNRPSFRQILMHIDIAATDVLTMPKKKYFNKQLSWRHEVVDYFKWLKSQGSQLTLVDNDFMEKKEEEIRQARKIRHEYEERLMKANELYRELNDCMLQLQLREEELKRREIELNVKKAVTNEAENCEDNEVKCCEENEFCTHNEKKKYYHSNEKCENEKHNILANTNTESTTKNNFIVSMDIASKKEHIKILNDNLLIEPECNSLKYSLKPSTISCAVSFNENLFSDPICHNRRVLNLKEGIKIDSEVTKESLNWNSEQESLKLKEQEDVENGVIEDLDITTELEWDLHEDLGRIRDVG
ncbi:mitogen-activated protein kinase kinase kinase 12 isoform X2 [Hydra vulgaris]|uniref:Mitogen-activated protein kinase kinase kinase 12 isoform X2 n=2 Tax=Hydra vulgaris TaxID=6087 RepID=A0ABM4C0E5_HYDVU